MQAVAKHYQYEILFSPYTRERKRIDGIMEGFGDQYPGTCPHEQVEACLVALAANRPAPYDLETKAKRGKSRAPTGRESNIIAPIARALQELFEAKAETAKGALRSRA